MAETSEIDELSALLACWDGEGGAKPSERSIGAALLYARLRPDILSASDVTLHANGHVMLEGGESPNDWTIRFTDKGSICIAGTLPSPPRPRPANLPRCPRMRTVPDTKDQPITWAQRVANLTKALGRRPTLDELMLLVPMHDMTPEERREQAESWARANISTGDPRFD